MRTSSLRILVLGALAAMALTACDERTDRTMGQKLDSALERTQQKLSKAGDKIAQQTDRAVSTVKEKTAANGDGNGHGHAAHPPRTHAMSDTAITASIKTDFLKDPDLSVLKIDVDTRGGVVTLNGLAENEEARERATRIAQGVKGVTEVRNHLVIKRV